MKEKIIAKRYAEAFFEFSKQRLKITESVQEFKDLKMIWFKNPELKGLLENLQILYKEKCEVIDAVFAGFSQEMKFFLKLLLEKDRIKEVVEICDYVRLTYAHGEAMDALLKTSHPLDLSLIRKIKSTLEEKLKRKVRFHIELDAGLLGGVQVQVGNTLIDGSVRRRLEELRKQLMLLKAG